MLGADYDRNAVRPQRAVYGVRKRVGQPLLHLRAARQDVQGARQLGHARYAPGGNVADVRAAKEWQQVMFAERMKCDIAQQHGFAVVFVKAGR